MKNLNYKKNKIEHELNSLQQLKKEYLENVEKNKISKRNMILYPILPILGGIITCGIYWLICKTFPPINFTKFIGIIVAAMECIMLQEEVEQIINYQNSKKVLGKTNLEEIETKIFSKQKEKSKILEEENEIIFNNISCYQNDETFKLRDFDMDDDIKLSAITPKSDEKVLVKKRNEGSQN